MAIRCSCVFFSISYLISSKWPLSGSGAGCYYRNNYAEALYGKNPTDQLPIHIRYYKDSFISADELTYGCSSSTTSSDSCFGISRKQQNITGSVLTGIGALLVLLEIGAVVGLCLCCKDTLKNLTSSKHKSMKKVPEAVPVAQPAYGQPAYGQPAYGQPAYGQPAYGQPQPGYGQPQPGYGQPANPYMPPPAY